MISPEQSRAARALLGWSQEDLETHSRVAKKTIADFERDVRNPRSSTLAAIQAALEEHGVVFIPQNGGGAGVRLRDAIPRLFRRDEVKDRNWVAFAFDYKAITPRPVAFIQFDALDVMSSTTLSPIEAFDQNRRRILLHAADKLDRGDVDPRGNVLIQAGELQPIPDPE
jgi:transcriptional regulator with XRE-family HTH domain